MHILKRILKAISCKSSNSDIYKMTLLIRAKFHFQKEHSIFFFLRKEQNGVELLTLSPQSLESWNFSHVPAYLGKKMSLFQLL